MGTRLAWTLAGITATLVVADAVITAQYRSLFSEAAVVDHGFPFVSAATLGSAVMGALIVTRDRRQVIGWMLAVLGVVGSLSVALEAYAVWILANDGPGSRAGAGVTGWVASLIGGQLAITMLVFLFLLVPDGRFLSPRWRIAAAVAGAGEVLVFLSVATRDPRAYDILALDTGGETGLRQLMSGVGFLAISAGFCAAVVSMVLRLRRSNGVERQQLRVVALSAAGICAGLVWMLVVDAFLPSAPHWMYVMPLFVSYVFFPVLLAIAVLRYRLYDIDVIVNRTLVLAAGTAFAGLGYVTLVVVVGDAVNSRTSDYSWSLVATVLVALAFQPLRRSVVSVANRMAFGARAQPYEALAEFSRRLSATPSAETVLSTVADAAGRAVSAHGATASLDASDLPRTSAFWGSDRAETLHQHGVLVQEGDLTLGAIEVSIPQGRPLRSSDVRLLRAIADQAAVAFHNMALEAQLRGHVDSLDRTATELADSRARIVEAEDSARRSLATGISREVLPHLEWVSDVLRRPAHPVPVSSQCIDEMVTGVNTALQSLRELTQGAFPAQLARSGLEPALRSYLRRRVPGLALEIAPGAVGQRFAPRVEAAVYFAATRAAATGSPPESIDLAIDGDNLRCAVTGAEPAALDVQSIRDRVDAVGGSVHLTTGKLELRIPLTRQ